MSELGDILGDDFEEEYEKQSAAGGQQSSQMTDRQMKEICYQAIQNGGFDKDEPRFRYQTETDEVDVLLMNSPEDDLGTFRFELGEDSMSQGMFHLGDLFSCAFQENMLDLLDKVELDTYYVVVGGYEEVTQTDDDGNEDTYYNINPVRGIVPLTAAQALAESYEKQMESTSIEEQSQSQQTSSDNESSSSNTDGSTDIDLGDDSDNGVTKNDIVPIFEGIGQQAPQVLQSTAEGDEDAMDKVVNITQNNIDGNPDRDFILDVFEDEVEEIDGRGEDEDDEVDIDIGGLDGNDSSDDDDLEVVDTSPTTNGGDTQTESSTSTTDEDSGPEDWFE